MFLLIRTVNQSVTVLVPKTYYFYYLPINTIPHLKKNPPPKKNEKQTNIKTKKKEKKKKGNEIPSPQKTFHIQIETNL